VLPIGHTDFIESALFSPDGKLALTASRDNTARIYEVSTGRELQVLTGHSNSLNSAVFGPDGKLALTASWGNTVRIYELATGSELQVLKVQAQDGWIVSAMFSPDGKRVLTTTAYHKTILWDAATGKALYTRLQLKNGDWLVYDEHYRFDGTQGAIGKLYFVCGLEVVELAQLKDSLWVPGLAEKITSGSPILINDRPAPTLNNLNICDLTPLIEPVEKGDKGRFRYRITPRRGGLGATEVYINGNLTYTFMPAQLERKMEQNAVVYYLTMSSDTLQVFLSGKTQSTNPIQVKSKTKDSGIYSRGVTLGVVKEREEDSPRFFGVFIGVDDYGNPSKAVSDYRYRNLDFAGKDAQDLSNAVETSAHTLFEPTDCFIYRLTATSGPMAPTKENMQRVLAEIGAKAKASDILYIFFAGHGDLITDSIGSRNIRFLLQQADKRNLKSTSFGVEELSQWCHPKWIKAQKRVFVFDACHSGQVINQTMAFNGVGRGDDDGARVRQLDKLKDKNGMMILAASADDESAYEDETLGQGVLTYHLLQAMQDQSVDTTLQVREWFDETIERVKEYSKANGNMQEPNSFGDGRFEIGNVNESVRNSIKISCPKTRIGRCFFSDPTGEAEALFPDIELKVNQYFAQVSGRGDLVFSKRPELSYSATGTFAKNGKAIKIRYRIMKGDRQVGNVIEMPPIKVTIEETLVEAITQSIKQEIARLDAKRENCKLAKNRP
jgi:hypothetical protein